MTPDFWRGRRVFLTGHTGFKGSWLSIWLQSLGAELSGLALAPPDGPGLFAQAKVGEGMSSALGDIRDLSTVQRAMAAHRPEIVIHMAAQPLVRSSYTDPVATYATNVMGTVHVLEAARRVDSVRAIVNVTTDKCYENREWVWGYREHEPMGGHDPYSNSKGCSELVTSAYRRSFLAEAGVAVATARAGNVIGGGDWATDRLVPDILRAFERGEPVLIRNPLSIRPWQHVLEPLSGYLTLAEKLLSDGQAWAEGWNFGPPEGDVKTVQWIVERMAREWGRGAAWRAESSADAPHEARYLKLDISKASSLLGWRPVWNLATALQQINLWHQAYLAGKSTRAVTMQQIDSFVQATRQSTAGD